MSMAAAGRVFINCATVSPEAHEAAAVAAAKAGAETLAASMASSIPQARQGTLYLMIGGDMINRDHDCYFSAAHAAKDSGIANALAGLAGVRVPLSHATEIQYQKMIELGLGELDKSGVAELTFPDRVTGPPV